MITVKNQHSVKVFNSFNKKFEHLDLIITTDENRIYISVCYFPPGSDNNHYEQYFNRFLGNLDITTPNKFCKLGDYHIPGHNWTTLNLSENRELFKILISKIT